MRPLLILSQQEQDQIQQRIEAGLATWKKTWLSDQAVTVDASLTVLFGDEAKSFSRARNWFNARLGSSKTFSTLSEETQRLLLKGLLPAIDSTQEINLSEVELVDSALNELFQACFGKGFSVSVERVDSSQLSLKFINTLCLGFNIGDAHFQVILPSDLIETLISRQKRQLPPIAKLDLAQTIANEELELTVKLPRFNLSLGDIQSLSVGDVLPLSIPLASPLELVTEDNNKIAQCYIGKNGNKKAVILSGSI